MPINNYTVAGFSFSINAPDSFDTKDRLPSFVPFAVSECNDKLFNVDIRLENAPDIADKVLLDKNYSITGKTRLYEYTDGYFGETTFGDSNIIHCLSVDKDFSNAIIYASMDDKSVGTCVTTLIQFVFAQAIVMHKGVMIHSSTITKNGYGFLFLGKSGTGKSTHSRLWLENIPETELLNDDNPIIIEKSDGSFWISGSPWSGKTSCYKNLCYPIGGIVRLSQAKKNEFKQLSPFEGLIDILPSCSVIQKDSELRNAMNDTLIALAETVTVARLACLPNSDAATLCFNELNKTPQTNKNES